MEPELKAKSVGFEAEVLSCMPYCSALLEHIGEGWAVSSIFQQQLSSLPCPCLQLLPILSASTLQIFQLLFERKNYIQPQVNLGWERRASKHMPLGNHIVPSFWFLLHMLRDKHGSKYAFSFSSLNVLLELVRSCHFLTHTVLCVGVALQPPTAYSAEGGGRLNGTEGAAPHAEREEKKATRRALVIVSVQQSSTPYLMSDGLKLPSPLAFISSVPHQGKFLRKPGASSFCTSRTVKPSF